MKRLHKISVYMCLHNQYNWMSLISLQFTCGIYRDTTFDTVLGFGRYTMRNYYEYSL